MDKTIKPADVLKGEIELPGDKSISHRVAFIGSIAKGRTTGKNFLKSEDCLLTVKALKDMGAVIEIENKIITVDAKGLKGALQKPKAELYLGNSGTTMRILPGIIAGQDFEATLAGGESLSGRPMERIIEPLKKMGVDIRSKNNNGRPPLVIKGGAVKPISYTSTVASGQVKSCILFAGLYAKGITSVTEPFPSRDHTERMLKFCGARISKKNLTVSIEGESGLLGKEFFIPGDISSAAFFIAASSVVEGASLVIRDVGLNPTRLGFLNVLIRMGAGISIGKKKDTGVEPYGDIHIKSLPLKAAIVREDEVPLLIDEVPILAVLASQANGTTIIKGIGELKVKETDRIRSLTENLKKMGVDIKTDGENIVINGRRKRFLKADLDSFGDHRTAMSMAVAALYADGDCVIKNADCVSKSFPEFFELLSYLAK